jgi:Na+-driven multidrug efflux pump
MRQRTGDTWTPTVNLFGFWLFQILSLYSSKHLELGPKGYYFNPVAETLITIVAFILFRKGKWKTVKV